MSGHLLHVEGLEVSFHTEEGVVRAVDGVSFTLDRGEVLAIVGESGSGKSVSVMTLMGLTRSPNASFGGRARVRVERPGAVSAGGEVELVGAPEEELRRVRGKEIAMVFQDPMTSLNPVQRVGDQIAEQIRAHEDVGAAEARARVAELLGRVGIPRAGERLRAYPHELSGGMRQRAMIAMALSCRPSVLIADEPTTALDVTTQAQILDELRALRDSGDTGVILVTHDLGVVAEIADRVAVMYAGRIVEEGTLDEIFYDPQHPYTWGLLGSIARIDRPRPERLPAIPGLPPSLHDPPEGCAFRPRCPYALEQCAQTPVLEARIPGAPGHRDRCLLDCSAKRELREVADGQIGLEPKGVRAP